MQSRELADRIRYSRMTTAELRDSYLLQDLFAPGEIRLHYIDVDRAIAGAAVPTAAPLKLGTYDQLRAQYFTERRELGVLNIGGAGTVTAGGVRYQMAKLDCLYIGRGTEEIVFESADAAAPAEFYLLSYPAHCTYPTAIVHKADIKPKELGSLETCNHRFIHQCIHADGIRSCQLVMGFTELAPGSNWNTMPPHTHPRRMEVYLYFGFGDADRVMHFMGPATETRHLVMADHEAVASPSWSIHSGVGTRAYTFCWGMGGENQDYTDMDALKIGDLR
jgi:4-deoxy-L-threo-5-hexosulose-uronate ketol-isomerase